MSEPLDVSLRVRLQYEAGGASRAIADIDKLKDKAAQLGATAGTGKLAADLDKVKAPADAATKKVADLADAATKLGATAGGERLAGDIAKVAAPAEKASRNVIDLSAAAAKLGQGSGARTMATELAAIGKATEPVKRDILDLTAQVKKLGGVQYKPFEGIELGKNLRRDFQALDRLTHSTRRDFIDLGQTIDRLGNGSGPAKLDRQLDEVGRHAEEARRKIDRLGGAEGGHGGGHGGGRGLGRGGGERGEAWDFGREALASAGMGNAARFGMGGAMGAGMAAGAGVAAIGGAMAYATRDAIKFETAMSEVNKAVDDLSPEKLKELENTILRISRTKGVDKGEIAAGVAQAGYAGRPSADLPRFAEFAAMTGPAWGISVEKAGDDLSKLGNIFHFNQQQLEGLANTVDYLGNKTAAREPDIADFLKRTGGTAQVFGLGADQTAAYGATMQAAGMQPEVAATAFNAIMQKLGSADKGGKAFTSALGEMHLSARGLMREIQQDPSSALVHFFEQLNKLPKEKQLGIAKELFGLEHSDEAMILAGQVGELVKNLGLLKDAGARTGSVENSFKVFSATTQASIARATAQLDTFATHLGQNFSPVVGAAADAVANFFGKINDGAERAAKAVEILDKIKKGMAITPDDKAAIDADPKLKANVDAGQEQLERNAVRDQGHGPATTVAPKPNVPATPEPEEPEAVAARERGRKSFDRQIDTVQGLVDRHVGDPAIQEQNRLKLFDLQRRRRLTFPDAPVAGDGKFPITVAPAVNGAVPTDPVPAASPSAVPATPAASVPPGTDKHAELATEAYRQLAAYNEEVDRGLGRTARLVHDYSAKIRDDLTIKARFETDVAPAGEGGIIKASYGGSADGGGWDDGVFRPGGRAGRSGGGEGGRYAGRLGSGRGGRTASLETNQDAGPPTPLGRTSAKFNGKAPAIMHGLMQRYGLTKEQAAGVVGNLGHESAGFTAYHEGGQAPGRGGVGWAQWTGPRRRAFEAWTKERGLNPTSDEASWRYLTEGDPETAKAIAAVKKQSTVEGSTKAFEQTFERAGVKAYGSRMKLARRAMQLGDDGAPADLARLNDQYRPDPAHIHELRKRRDFDATPTTNGRFADPATMKPRPGTPAANSAEGGGASTGGRGAPAAPLNVQNFYGNHDPAETARFAQMQQNRHTRRTLAAALHDVGGPAG